MTCRLVGCSHTAGYIIIAISALIALAAILVLVLVRKDEKTLKRSKAAYKARQAVQAAGERAFGTTDDPRYTNHDGSHTLRYYARNLAVFLHQTGGNETTDYLFTHPSERETVLILDAIRTDGDHIGPLNSDERNHAIVTYWQNIVTEERAALSTP